MLATFISSCKFCIFIQIYINYRRWTVAIFGYCLALEQPKLYTGNYFLFLATLCFQMFAFMMLYNFLYNLFIVLWFVHCSYSLGLSPFPFHSILQCYCQFSGLDTHTHTHTHTQTHTHLACAQSFTMHLYEIQSDIFASFLFVVFFSLSIRFFLLNINLCICSYILWSKIK